MRSQGMGWNIGNKKETWEVTKQEGLKVAQGHRLED